MISWNEIRDRAIRFSRDWEEETRETGEYQSFWNDFFGVFDKKRRSIAIYQQKVNLLAGKRGYIDLFWPGVILAEHKSAGEDLDAAFTQATDYFDGIREEEKPRFVIVTDYKRIRLYDLEGEDGIKKNEFFLADFSENIRLFSFIAGYEVRIYKDEDPVSAKAVKAIAKLYEALVDSNYPREAIDKLLTKLVFCFFADDTGIFNRDTIKTYFEYMTKEDGSDIGAHISLIFQILNTPVEKRQTTIDDDLKGLPYVNGGLFSEPLPAIFGTKDIRKTLISCTMFNWSRVSPGIFGSMFQSVMNEKARHDIGAHYTSEKNILKVIGGLFLDDLKKELEDASNNYAKLNSLWEKISKITLLDPACGCGNFLVISYRELRKLELEILKKLFHKTVESKQSSLPFDVTHISKFSVERMYGIEVLPFPVEVARLSLWLVDHMANVELGVYFGEPFAKLPLTERPHIVQGNALRVKWESVVPKEGLSYILGNPPFISKQDRDSEQKEDMKLVFGDLKGAGEVDYVAAWYMKAIEFIQGSNVTVAFVSTNSITQGEQVGILWPELLKRGAKIQFAHRTFRWTNEAPGKAAVHCVIISFSVKEPAKKQLFDYEDPSSEPHLIEVDNINPYLVDAGDIVVTSRRKPLSRVPSMLYGSKPADGGFLILDDREKEDVSTKDQLASRYIKPLLSAKEYLSGKKRWCLWLVDANPGDLKSSPFLLQHIAAVRSFREMSTKKPTQKLAETPALFAEIRQPQNDFVLVPIHSSENRKYVPLSFFSKDNIVHNSCSALPSAELYHYGILQSKMHMAWMRTTCGRLKSDYRYSNELVYNNFPWPENLSAIPKQEVEEMAQKVLDTRDKFPNATLADLYDPDTMPKPLLDAHYALDRAVDACYGKRSFKSEAERLKFLFELYEKLVK